MAGAVNASRLREKILGWSWPAARKERLSGGLLRYNRVTGAAQRYELPGVIASIDRAGDTLYLASSIGLYLFRNDSLTLMRLEPVATDRWDMVVRDVREGR